MMNLVDEHYLSLHKHHFVAGRNFNARLETAKETEVIVNEQLAETIQHW